MRFDQPIINLSSIFEAIAFSLMLLKEQLNLQALNDFSLK